MWKIIGVILLLLLGGVGYVWFSAQSLPDWFDQDAPQSQAIDKLSETIRREGVASFLGNKVGDVLDGELTLSETEFNALLLASLKSDADGRKLLSVSDGIHATIHRDKIELGAVINLDKVEKINPKARKAIEKADNFLLFLDDSRVALTVFGTPVARNGQIGIKDDFHIKVGALPISNDTLKKLGAHVERANTSNLKLKYVRVQSISLNKGEIVMQVLPRF